MLQVVDSKLTLEGTGLHLIGNNVTLKRNTIHASSEKAISLKANENLNIEENTFTESNALDLNFPGLGLRSIILRGTDLKRPKMGFIRAKVLGTLRIDNCQIELDNKEVFVVDVQHLSVANSTVYSMNRESFKAHVRSQVEILDSFFEDCKPKAFYGINGKKGPAMTMRRNTFLNFKNGCLMLDKFNENFDVDLEIARIDLLKKCHCWLAHELITEDLEKSHLMHTEGHVAFEKILQRGIR